MAEKTNRRRTLVIVALFFCVGLFFSYIDFDHSSLTSDSDIHFLRHSNTSFFKKQVTHPKAVDGMNRRNRTHWQSNAFTIDSKLSRQSGTKGPSRGTGSSAPREFLIQLKKARERQSQVKQLADYDHLKSMLGKVNLSSGDLNLMTLKPFDFLPNYKNPCWKEERLSPPIACLPYFYLVGAPKAGTTDVFKRLLAHPEFSQQKQKEPHWLSRVRFRKTSLASSIYYYSLKYFSNAARLIYSSTDDSGYHRFITGDCSASTLFDNYNWRRASNTSGLEEPKYTNADYIHHINPRTKIIVMLRDPVERLYSDFLFFEKKLDSQVTFHDAAKQSIEMMNKCLTTHTLRYCLYNPILPAKKLGPRGEVDDPEITSQVRTRIGIYHGHLREFLRVFPRSQILILKLEDYSLDPAKSMKHIFKFLDLSETVEPNWNKINDTTTHANQRSTQDKEKGDMWPTTRQMLREFYKPHNDALAKLLNDDQFNYN